MCAKLLSCPLCSQAAFLTLNALRTGLISVATRPLACPVCNEVLLGIDKLTIHLFSHSIDLSNERNAGSEPARNVDNLLLAENNVNDNEQIFPAWKIVNKSNQTKLVSVEFPDYASEPAAKVSEPSTIDDQRCTAKTHVVSTSSQTPNTENLSNDLDSLVQGTSQLIFVPNGTLLNQDQSLDNLFQGQVSHADNYRASGDNSGLTASEDSSDRLDTTETTGRAATSATVANNIVQLQPIWTTNLSNLPQNCSQNCVPSVGGQTLTLMVQKTDDKPPTTELVPPVTLVPQASARNVEKRREPIKNLPQLKAIRALVAKEKTERCDICGFYFADPNILTLHKQLAHMIDEKDLNEKPEDLLKNYPCHLCSKVFKMRGSLMVHMRVAHVGYNLGSIPKDGTATQIAGETGFNCPTCGKNFKKEQHVTQHLKTHEGKQWECDVCSKMFTTKYFLKKHKRLHSGEMPYKCNICDKTFTFQQSYHKHRLYHKDDKPHTCTTCGRSFKELSTLHNHERIHTGEKPFACETCGKCFRQRVSYLVHRRIHTGAMPYKCTSCGKNFRYKVSQRTHKCATQPPGIVIRQSSEFVQRLLQVTQDKNQSADGSIVQIQEAQSFVTDNENKFILIVNSQGQHILTRQPEAVEVPNIATTTEPTSEGQKDSNDRFIEDLWSQIPISVSGTTLKDSIEISVQKNDIPADHGKSDPTNDFFSMVLSPIGVQSPSSQLEHLRLSSPTNKDDTLENIPNGKHLESDLSDTSTFRNHNSLATINEESLKQLLYGVENEPR